MPRIIFKAWEEVEHPRGPGGRFIDALGGLIGDLSTLTGEATDHPASTVKAAIAGRVGKARVHKALDDLRRGLHLEGRSQHTLPSDKLWLWAFGAWKRRKDAHEPAHGDALGLWGDWLDRTWRAVTAAGHELRTPRAGDRVQAVGVPDQFGALSSLGRHSERNLANAVNGPEDLITLADEADRAGLPNVASKLRAAHENYWPHTRGPQGGLGRDAAVADVHAALHGPDLTLGAPGSLLLPRPGTGPDTAIHVHGDTLLAADLLGQGKHVRLDQPDEVSVLLDELASRVNAAREAGNDAPNYDLCKVSVPGTNLFCAESKNVPRIEMPQLKGFATPGSRADGLGRVDDRGETDLAAEFRQHLLDQGHHIEDVSVESDHLKATQRELNGAKVAGIANFLSGGGTIEGPPLFVSSDNYIVDGHHRWAAQIGVDAADGHLGDEQTPVQRVDMPITELLFEANTFAADWGLPQQGVNTPGSQPDRVQAVAFPTDKHGEFTPEALATLDRLAAERAAREGGAHIPGGDPAAKVDSDAVIADVKDAVMNGDPPNTWEPGTWGKGFYAGGEVYTWPTTQPVDGEGPHHAQIEEETGLDAFSMDRPADHLIVIAPDGTFTGTGMEWERSAAMSDYEDFKARWEAAPDERYFVRGDGSRADIEATWEDTYGYPFPDSNEEVLAEVNNSYGDIFNDGTLRFLPESEWTPHSQQFDQGERVQAVGFPFHTKPPDHEALQLTARDRALMPNDLIQTGGVDNFTEIDSGADVPPDFGDKIFPRVPEGEDPRDWERVWTDPTGIIVAQKPKGAPRDDLGLGVRRIQQGRSLNGEELEAVRRGLTPAEARAGNDYSSNLSREINETARGNDPFSHAFGASGGQFDRKNEDEQRAEAKAVIPVLDNLIAERGVDPRTVDTPVPVGDYSVGFPEGETPPMYRGIHFDRLSPEAQRTLTTEGEVFGDKGFISLTYGRDTAREFTDSESPTILEITLPGAEANRVKPITGADRVKALYVPDYFSGSANQREGEFIFPRGTRLRVDSVEVEGEANVPLWSYQGELLTGKDLMSAIRARHPDLDLWKGWPDDLEHTDFSDADIQEFLAEVTSEVGAWGDEAAFRSGYHHHSPHSRTIHVTMLPPGREEQVDLVQAVGIPDEPGTIIAVPGQAALFEAPRPTEGPAPRPPGYHLPDELIHGTLAENTGGADTMNLEPMIGPFVRDAYEGEYTAAGYANMEDAGVVPAVSLTDWSEPGRALNAIRAQIGYKLDKEFRDVTREDVAEFGALIVFPEGKRDSVVRRYDEGNIDYTQQPEQVEEGDYFTLDPLYGGDVLTGDAMMAELGQVPGLLDLLPRRLQAELAASKSPIESLTT